MPDARKKEGVAPSRLLRIPPDRIERNPENPRLIFRQKDLDLLAESIKESGILVPLIVFPKEGEADRYMLLDGERRWMCALRLNLLDVPCNVIAPPTPVENILRMFNIHKVRKDWDLMPTALKLGRLRDLLGITKSDQLARLTGLSRASVERCKKLLSFDPRYQKMLLDGRFKEDLFVEMYPILGLLEKRLPEVLRQRGEDGVIEALLAKFDRRGMKAVTDFRFFSKIIRSTAKGFPKRKIARLVESLLRSPELSVEETYRRTVELSYEAASLARRSGAIAAALQTFDARSATHRDIKELRRSLRELRSSINELLAKLRRGSDDG